jgi:integrase
MGSIRRPREGRGWEARYRDPSGRQRSAAFRTKREAERFLARVEADQQRGEWRDPQLAKVRFGSVAEQWLKSTTHLRAGTRANVEIRVRRHILPSFGDQPIGAIQPADVRAWVSGLTESGLSPSTVVAIYGVLRRIMRTAEIDGLIHRTPCLGISLPKETSHQEMHFLDHSEVARLAAAIDERYRSLIFTAAYTGLRWGELAGLRVDRVNLLRGTVDVAEAMTETNGHLATAPTKTGARRTVSLPRFLSEMLAGHIAAFPTTTGLVFSSAEGQPLRRNFYRRHFKPAVRNAGLPEALRFHDLRHSCAAMLIAQAAHPKEIQERLGHSTIRLTFDRYGHLFPGLDERLRDGLETGFRAAQQAPAPPPADVRTLRSNDA